MSRPRQWLLAATAIFVGTALFAGCGIPQEDYDALRADYEALQAQYDAVRDQLEQLQAVFPPRDFSSITELEEWLADNDVSEEPPTEFAGDWYRRALKVQEDALRDGYIVSADYDWVEDKVVVWCTTVIRGRVFFWDPETDDVTEDTAMATVK